MYNNSIKNYGLLFTPQEFLKNGLLVINTLIKMIFDKKWLNNHHTLFSFVLFKILSFRMVIFFKISWCCDYGGINVYIYLKVLSSSQEI